MKIYIAGKITGLDNYKAEFQQRYDKITKEGHTVMNPAVLPPGFDHAEYMHVCYSMIDVCEGVYFMNNWLDSTGAKLEHEYAVSNNKYVIYEDSYHN